MVSSVKLIPLACADNVRNAGWQINELGTNVADDFYYQPSLCPSTGNNERMIWLTVWYTVALIISQYTDTTTLTLKWWCTSIQQMLKQRQVSKWLDPFPFSLLFGVVFTLQLWKLLCLSQSLTWVFYVPLRWHGAERDTQRESAQNVNSGEDESLTAHAGVRTRNLSITSPTLYRLFYPDPRSTTRSKKSSKVAQREKKLRL